MHEFNGHDFHLIKLYKWICLECSKCGIKQMMTTKEMSEQELKNYYHRSMQIDDDLPSCDEVIMNKVLK